MLHKQKMRLLWEEEATRMAAQHELESMDRERKANRDYWTFFHNVSSSGDIIHFNWPTKQSVKADEEFLEKVSGFDIFAPEESSIIHSDGLQQARSIDFEEKADRIQTNENIKLSNNNSNNSNMQSSKSIVTQVTHLKSTSFREKGIHILYILYIL